MTVAEAQARVSSLEFAEWGAFYWLEAEESGLVEREPTPEEVGDKLRAFVALHNAKLAAKGRC